MGYHLGNLGALAAFIKLRLVDWFVFQISGIYSKFGKKTNVQKQLNFTSVHLLKKLGLGTFHI